MKNWVKIVLSVCIVLAGVGISWVLVKTKPKAAQKPRSIQLPFVDVTKASRTDYAVRIASQGEVIPGRRTSLAAEVSGKVVWVSPKFEVGERFEEDEILIEIDRADYEAAEILAASELATAALNLEKEHALSAQAKRDWEALGGGGKASELVLRKPQLSSAIKRVDAAQAALDKAKRDLLRTKVRAPYSCQLKATFTDKGSLLVSGALIADLFSRDFELRLPVSLEDFRFIDMTSKVEVTFMAGFGGEEVTWKGSLLRTEGQVDRGSQSVFLVAGIEPGKPGTTAAKFLVPGIFLRAELTGRLLTSVYRIPRRAFYGKDRILVVNADRTAELRSVTVIRTERDEVVVSKGIDEGELVAISPVPNVIDGMSVKVNADSGTKGLDDGAAVSGD
ncbi:MAG: efflux RND transporter periplasmic adaptor subunit [Verrucomicrobiales bacterium]|nr:efflux RND transporter periplasmic adaptor subunit [Verrucomicrobiales bacterium]MED5585124.1 efflux RND transporter periplasmic adaptor subunit [Verrucomicrobiota bacterium]